MWGVCVLLTSQYQYYTECQTVLDITADHESSASLNLLGKLNVQTTSATTETVTFYVSPANSDYQAIVSTDYLITTLSLLDSTTYYVTLAQIEMSTGTWK